MAGATHRRRRRSWEVRKHCRSRAGAGRALVVALPWLSLIFGWIYVHPSLPARSNCQFIKYQAPGRRATAGSGAPKARCVESCTFAGRGQRLWPCTAVPDPPGRPITGPSVIPNLPKQARFARAKPLPARECQTSPRRRVGGGAARSYQRTPAVLVAPLLPPTHTVRLHVRAQPRTLTRLPRQLEHLRATLLRAGRMGCARTQQWSARGMPHRVRTPRPADPKQARCSHI